MTQACDDGPNVLYSPISLGMILGCRMLFTPKQVHEVSKNLLKKCAPLYYRRMVGIPYGAIRWSKKIDTIWSAVFFDEERAQDNFVQRSLLTMINRFLVVILGNGPSIAMTKNSRACWRGTFLGGVFPWGKQGFWYSHRSCRLSCKHCWTCMASRATVSRCRTCGSHRCVPPVLGNGRDTGGVDGGALGPLIELDHRVGRCQVRSHGGYMSSTIQKFWLWLGLASQKCLCLLGYELRWHSWIAGVLSVPASDVITEHREGNPGEI